MAMPATPLLWTAEMVRALPEDGNRYEVVHGELLVSPAPRPWHQEVVWRLMRALHDYLERERRSVEHSQEVLEQYTPFRKGERTDR